MFISHPIFFLAEQTSVSISDVVFNSATFMLTCGLVETDIVMYELLDLTNSTISSTVLTFSCGSTLTLELMPDTNYTLMQHYGDQECIIDGFTTPEQSKCLELTLSTNNYAVDSCTCS